MGLGRKAWKVRGGALLVVSCRNNDYIHQERGKAHMGVLENWTLGIGVWILFGRLFVSFPEWLHTGRLGMRQVDCLCFFFVFLWY